MANIPAELRALPLEHIIGSPLVAAIKAQGLAAQQTVEFIKEVGLKPNDVQGEPSLEARYVSFKFDRILEQEKVEQGNTIREMVVTPSQITVPFLSIVPIPYIRIDNMTIDFEFQIRDIEVYERETEATVDVKLEARYWWIKASIKGSYSNRTANKRTTDRRTTLRIVVNAVQDEIPEGLGRILDMLHESIQAVPLPGE